MKPDKKTLDKWAKMTDENQHFEVRREIAEHFWLDGFAVAFDELIDARDKGIYAINAENLLTDVMFEKIRKQYGDDAADAALACL